MLSNFSNNSNQRDQRGVAPTDYAEIEANGDLWSTNEGCPSLVGSLGSSCRYRRFLSCLGCSGQPNTKVFFLTVHYFNLRVPIAQQPGQAVVLGRLSLSPIL